MALDPTYKSKTVAAVTSVLDKVTSDKTVVNVRPAQPGYPVDMTYCTIGGKIKYEVDHTDGDGKTRSPDEVAAILKQLMYDGGHAVDPKSLSTNPAPESQPSEMDKI